MRLYPADAGKIFLEGKEVTITRPSDARALGIEMVYQDLALAPNLDVVSNMFLGREEICQSCAGHRLRFKVSG